MMRWETLNIDRVIKDIEDIYPKYVLPVMQRFFVWDEEQVENLFTSLLKGNSFGAIIVIDEDRGKKPMFASRKFVLHLPEDKKLSDNNECELESNRAFVVDGQQRLQAFYIGLRGTLNSKKLYFNLLSSVEDKEFEFKFFNSSDKNINKNENEFWYEVNKIYSINKSAKDLTEDILKSKEIYNDKKETIRENLTIFFDSITRNPVLGISRVNIQGDDTDKNREFALDMFVSINNGGTRLTSFDLISSTLKKLDWRMEGFLDDMLLKYKDIGLGQNELIKLIFILKDGNSQKSIAKIDSSDATFAIDNRNKIDRVLNKLKEFLQKEKINGIGFYDYYKSGRHSFIPFYIILSYFYNLDDTKLDNIFKNFDTNMELNNLKKWLIHSLITSSLFSYQGAGWNANTTGLKLILDILKKNINKEFPMAEIFDLYKNRLHFFKTVYEVKDLDMLDRNFLFFIMYGENTQYLEGRRNDIDHIIPKSSLIDKYKDEPAIINSVKNFQLLLESINRGSKNATPFYKWINSEDVQDKNKFLEIHLIPKNEELWHEDRYKDFIEERGKLILERINTALK